MNLASHRLCRALVAAVLMTLALSACAPVMMGGAFMGSMSAADRRTLGAQIEDEAIESKAAKRIEENLGDRVHVNLTSYNRQVLLTGEVPNDQDKQLVEQVVSRVENIRSIFNELAVLGHSTLTQRSSDTLVTAKVKSELIDAKDLTSSAFKVVTERGTTFLMGRVTRREADRATDIARNISGVQKVVRLFEIITEEELLQLQPTPSDPKNGAGRTTNNY
jgi:osmotically-inducible protein OsmY